MAPRYCCGWYRHHRHVAIRGRTQIMWPAKATKYALRMPASHMLCTVPYFCPCSSIVDCHRNDIYDCPWVSPSITGKCGLFIYNWETASLLSLLYYHHSVHLRYALIFELLPPPLSMPRRPIFHSVTSRLKCPCYLLRRSCVLQDFIHWKKMWSHHKSEFSFSSPKLLWLGCGGSES